MKNRATTKILGSNARGFTLIETLIALLVLSIGLTGLAALHITSLQFAHSAYYRSLVSAAALELEERLWVNAANLAPAGGCLDAADFAQVLTDLRDNWSGTGSLGVLSSEWAWNTSVPWAQIPDLTINFGDLEDSPDSPPIWSQVPVTFTWNERRFRGGPTLERFDFTVRVVCLN